MKHNNAKLQRILNVLVEIKKDCISLKRKGELTEYGSGQLDLIRIIHQEIKK